MDDGAQVRKVRPAPLWRSIVTVLGWHVTGIAAFWIWANSQTTSMGDWAWVIFETPTNMLIVSSLPTAVLTAALLRRRFESSIAVGTVASMIGVVVAVASYAALIGVLVVVDR